ncbi:MAG: hypothetical protein PHP03_01560 [Candidatus Pacebacteria bacterium]|nr:hypothetical protein [Candidatus Paceibacterota bacterium]
MTKNLYSKILFFTAFFIFIFVWRSVSAHQPRIVFDSKEVIEVKNPEISQAFYGNLNGKPDYYSINADKDFNFYVGILVPKFPDVDKDFLVKIYQKENPKEYIYLNGKTYNWTEFYEKFAGDDYFKGPEVRVDLKKGDYVIEVSSQDNIGKYALAIGEKESFSPIEIVKTIVALPALKSLFFGKSPFTAFFNLIGAYLFGFIIVIVISIFVIVKIVKFLKTKNLNNK